MRVLNTLATIPLASVPRGIPLDAPHLTLPAVSPGPSHRLLPMLLLASQALSRAQAVPLSLVGLRGDCRRRGAGGDLGCQLRLPVHVTAPKSRESVSSPRRWPRRKARAGEYRSPDGSGGFVCCRGVRPRGERCFRAERRAATASGALWATGTKTCGTWAKLDARWWCRKMEIWIVYIRRRVE